MSQEQIFFLTLLTVIKWPLFLFLMVCVLAIRLPNRGIMMIQKLILWGSLASLAIVRLIPSKIVRKCVDIVIVRILRKK